MNLDGEVEAVLFKVFRVKVQAECQRSLLFDLEAEQFILPH